VCEGCGIKPEYKQMKTTQSSSLIKVFLVVLSVTLLSACGTTRLAIKKYAGSWEYHIDTPDGPIDAAMVITHDGEKFTGTMEADQGSIELEDLKIEEGKLTAHFYYGIYLIDISGEFNEDEFTGTLGPPEYQMPFTATRVK
jgi:hypothetical protein